MRSTQKTSDQEAAGVRLPIPQPTRRKLNDAKVWRHRHSATATNRKRFRQPEHETRSCRTPHTKTSGDPLRCSLSEQIKGTCTMSPPTIPTGLNEWAGQTKSGVRWQIFRGDVRQVIQQFDDNRFDCVVTSPPYFWQRDYKVESQIGLESTIAEYVAAIVGSMEAVRRVLRPNGLLFLNISDTYYSAKGKPKGTDKKNPARRFGLRAVDASGLGVPRKTLIGIPWRVSLAMIEKGWVLRSPIVWRKEKFMPEPTAKDRPWRTYEHVFMFSKSPKYIFDREALNGEEDIWTIPTKPNQNKVSHFSAFPEELVKKCLDIGCKKEGEVLDPFAGTGTTLKVALQSGRPAVGVDLKPEFCDHMVKSLSSL